MTDRTHGWFQVGLLPAICFAVVLVTQLWFMVGGMEAVASRWLVGTVSAGVARHYSSALA